MCCEITLTFAFQVLEYDKFKQCCLEINKRYMYCLQECFKELVEFEAGKAKPKKKAGGKSVQSQESVRFTQACFDVLMMLDEWNKEDLLQMADFQVIFFCLTHLLHFNANSINFV